MRKNEKFRNTDDPYFRQLNTFLNTSNSESERGRVLVASSLIEEMLEEILRARLSDGETTSLLMNGGSAPIGTFSAKAKLSRSLCLISEKEYRDIDLIRRIRNKFAHSVRCSFQDQQITDWAMNLKVAMGDIDALDQDGEMFRVDPSLSRFSMVSTALVVRLYNRAQHVLETKVKDVYWPS